MAHLKAELLDWIQKVCVAALEEDFLRVFTVSDRDCPHWHASVGKNTSHKCAVDAGVDVLVNCDADNLLGTGFPVQVLTMMTLGVNRECRTVCQWYSGDRRDGTFGRIAYSSVDFEAINGYDEDVYPMGGQDADILQRVQMLPVGQTPNRECVWGKNKKFCPTSIPNYPEASTSTGQDERRRRAKVSNVDLVALMSYCILFCDPTCGKMHVASRQLCRVEMWPLV